jgi:AraC-like DNA-binding protein
VKPLGSIGGREASANRIFCRTFADGFHKAAIMLNDIYITLTTALATALFVLGVLFYSLSRNAETPVFRTALRLMVFTYCFFGMVNVLDLYSRTLPGADDALIFQTTTLIVAVSQAFLFTFTLVLLIRSGYVTRKRMLRELVPIFALSAILVAACIILPADWVKIAVYLFTVFYITLLIRYMRLFFITYRDCLRKMDNFFSGAEAEHLKWVNFSFHAALSIGVLALVTSFFPVIHIGILCSAIYLLFYIYFACRLIGYGNIYKKLENALAVGEHQPELPQEDKNTLQPLIAKSITNSLQTWIDEKRFLQAGITIDDLALHCGTNRSYISAHINSAKGKTFRQWMNELRIDHAIRLFDENPHIELFEIARLSGYADSKYFSTCFKKTTGQTPSEYRGKAKIPDER